MTVEEHLKLIIGELTITVAALRAELDTLKAAAPKKRPA